MILLPGKLNLKSAFILFTGLILATVSYFVVNVNISGYSIISVLFIMALAVPSFLAIIRGMDGRGVILILILGVYAIVLETIAIITGFPYSGFHYTGIIGLKLLGYTPFTVPFAWLPIFLGCAYLAKESVDGLPGFLLLTAFLAVLCDMVIDPMAVALRFWVWDNPGIFYGVPLQNFAGWLLTGFLAALILLAVLRDGFREMPEGSVSSLYLIMCFWTAASLFTGLEVPFITGTVIITLILYRTGLRLW